MSTGVRVSRPTPVEQLRGSAKNNRRTERILGGIAPRSLLLVGRILEKSTGIKCKTKAQVSSHFGRDAPIGIDERARTAMPRGVNGKHA